MNLGNMSERNAERMGRICHTAWRHHNASMLLAEELERLEGAKDEKLNKYILMYLINAPETLNISGLCAPRDELIRLVLSFTKDKSRPLKKMLYMMSLTVAHSQNSQPHRDMIKRLSDAYKLNVLSQ